MLRAQSERLGEGAEGNEGAVREVRGDSLVGEVAVSEGAVGEVKGASSEVPENCCNEPGRSSKERKTRHEEKIVFPREGEGNLNALEPSTRDSEGSGSDDEKVDKVNGTGYPEEDNYRGVSATVERSTSSEGALPDGKYKKWVWCYKDGLKKITSCDLCNRSCCCVNSYYGCLEKNLEGLGKDKLAGGEKPSVMMSRGG